MPKIKDIQQEANDENVSVSRLLRDAKVLASDLQQADFLAWIDKELDGYLDGDKPSEYRVVKGIPQANNNGAWVPLKYSDAETQEIISGMAVGQSVGELEELLKYKGDYFILKFPPQVEKLLREHFGTRDFQLSIGKSEVIKILNHVRNTIFDWCIELKKKGVSDETSEFTGKDIQGAEAATPKYHIEHIDHFEGNIGDNNVVSKKISITSPPESFWSKFFWYVIVALIVAVLAGLILKNIFGIGTT
jgi:hypothetical protein